MTERDVPAMSGSGRRTMNTAARRKTPAVAASASRGPAQAVNAPANAGPAERVGQRADGHDRQERPGREAATHIEAGDQGERDEADQVIERDQSHPPVTVEQSARDGAQGNAWRNG